QSNFRTQDFDSLNSNVKDIVAHCEKNIAQIDANIEQLLRQIQQLKFERSQREGLVKRCQGMVTLARRIPAEILASIFEICVNDGWTLTPLQVSQVCSEWRKAANNPSIWSHIYVNCDVQDPYRRTKFWLDRAQNSPLKVTIEARQDHRRLPRVMALLMTRISQWRSLSVMCNSYLHVMQLLSYCRRPSPALRCINITIEQEFDITNQGEDNGSGTPTLLHVAFPEAPQLQFLRFRRSVLPPPRFCPPSITALCLDLAPDQAAAVHITIGAIAELLRFQPNLHTFSLSVSGSVLIETEIDEIFTLAMVPNMQRLTLSGPPGLLAVLPFLRTSALTNLHLISPLDSTGYPRHDRIDAYLRQFVTDTKPPLQLLEIRDIDISSGTFIILFTNLPDLRELRLHESEIPDSALQLLEGPGSTCPHLQYLNLRWCNQITGDALVKLVKSRLDNDVDSITGITVINCAFVGDYDIMALAEMTVCRLVLTDEDDMCRLVGCCVNARYRRRLELLAKSSVQSKQRKLLL
ncbi:hypothetical protein JOM56_008675, partial [Amanita muscaria]